jgi:hypothetical protein
MVQPFGFLLGIDSVKICWNNCYHTPIVLLPKRVKLPKKPILTILKTGQGNQMADFGRKAPKIGHLIPLEAGRGAGLSLFTA